MTRVTVGHDTDQSFRVCEVNLATLKVATKEKDNLGKRKNNKKKRKNEK